MAATSGTDTVPDIFVLTEVVSRVNGREKEMP